MDTESKKEKFFLLDPRLASAKALTEWEKRGATLDLVLSEILPQVRKENRPFFLEITKGVIRNLLFLDYKLEKILNRSLSSLLPDLKNLLRVSAYQLEFMHIPKPVVVDIAVELSKKIGHPGIVKLVNAGLRKLAEGVALELPSDPVERLSLVYSHPSWMVKRWISRFGIQDTETLLQWNNTIPLLEVRVNRMRVTPEAFVDIGRHHGVPMQASPFEEAFSLEPSGPVEKLPGYAEGFFWIQSFSALFPALLLNPKPGEKILDLCSAPAGKACQMAEMTEDKAEILAVDNNPERLKKVEENRRRLGFTSIHPLLADGRECGRLFPRWADAVLVDAPCTATGALRRKPDARWRRKPSDLPEYVKLQEELLESAALAVKPGGRIVYATCSLELEENEGIVEHFLLTHPKFFLEEPSPYLPKSILAMNCIQNGFLKILPQVCRMDGFFSARLKRKHE
jgi:16S rRNA (cytosine967-C5)-methyltransferase